jgi:hydrogenase/urease accessory protein HupE
MTMPSRTRLLYRFLVWAAFVATLVFSRSAQAHKPSDSYLTLTVHGARVEGRWDIAIRDLDNAMGIDHDGNGVVTWGELRARQADIAALALGHLTIRDGDTVCSTKAHGLEVASHSDGTYAVLFFDATCPGEPHVLDVDYELFFAIDPQHHGIVRVDDGAGTRTAIFTPDDRRQRFEKTTLARGHQLRAAIELGIHHIFTGIDHLLFLIALLLPSVLVRKDGRWQPATQLRPVITDVLKIVTAFTVAHSITLSLSALDVLRLPSRFVEASIAASVVVAALNNIVRVLEEDRWTAAFAFGLLHGFGFSATLMDLGLPRDNLVLTLFGFNVGVEIGQMCVVAAFLPLAYFARKTVFYRRIALVAGSVVIAALASVWFIERAFVVKIF